MTINLCSQTPFASGGNRLCFVHPQDADRCIKVRRPDFTLADARRLKGFPKNLRPLSWFDDNLEEHRVMQDIEARFGDAASVLISRCYGFEETNMGKGLTSELIRNGDGRISRSLKQYLWDNGNTEELQAAVARFCHIWCSVSLPSRDLLIHNLVIQCHADQTIRRIVVIDGLGSSGLVPDHWLPSSLCQARAKRKVARLNEHIQAFLARRTDDNPAYLNYRKGAPTQASKARTHPQEHLGMLIHEGISNVTNTAPRKRLAAYGDCNTLGFGPEQGQGFPEKIAQAIGYEVSNFGHTMCTSRELLAYAKAYPPSQFDLVLIQYGLVDSWLTFRHSPYVPYFPDSPLRKILRKIVKKVKKYARAFRLQERWGAVEVVPLEEYIANVECVVATAPMTQFILIGTAPNIEEQRNPRILRYNKALIALAEKHTNCHYVDAYDDIYAARDTLFADNTHLNHDGLQLLTEKIMPTIRRAIAGEATS